MFEVSKVVRLNKSAYIAGPMSGYKDFNFTAFNQAAADFRQRGWDVFNPAEKDLEQHRAEIFQGNGNLEDCEAKGFNLRDALAWDTARICESDAIYMLKGWEKSQGAFAEWSLAKALGLEIIYQ